MAVDPSRVFFLLRSHFEEKCRQVEASEEFTSIEVELALQIIATPESQASPDAAPVVSDNAQSPAKHHLNVDLGLKWVSPKQGSIDRSTTECSSRSSSKKMTDSAITSPSTQSSSIVDSNTTQVSGTQESQSHSVSTQISPSTSTQGSTTQESQSGTQGSWTRSHTTQSSMLTSSKTGSSRCTSIDEGATFDTDESRTKYPKRRSLRKRSKGVHEEVTQMPTPDPATFPFSGGSRRVIIMRHAERVDRVFPTWTRLWLRYGNYVQYDLNLPTTVPKRRGGAKAFEADPPITEYGRSSAQLAAKAMRRMKHPVTAIVCSPALRCIQTAQEIMRDIGVPGLSVRIEPGLFDWTKWYAACPNFMTDEEIEEAGVKIQSEYTPIMTRQQLQLLRGETKHDYYRRAQDVIARILTITHNTILVIGHAITLDASVRPLLGLPKDIPAFRQLDRLADLYPYCAAVVLDQTEDGGQWVVGSPLLPTTSADASTKHDTKFLLRS
ncbi:hypothetical protein L596_012587 [Steinernema carpocapsae]|uniref:Phosphoglycerate mutase family protein n=1 Tax=Steinernema carpocapsae TaxID=34508 RepID=A0A4U5NY48_STECR|nr:hypothetical protein L596_012587 [Steinernema carpocapsae]